MSLWEQVADYYLSTRDGNRTIVISMEPQVVARASKLHCRHYRTNHYTGKLLDYIVEVASSDHKPGKAA